MSRTKTVFSTASGWADKFRIKDDARGVGADTACAASFSCCEGERRSVWYLYNIGRVTDGGTMNQSSPC